MNIQTQSHLRASDKLYLTTVHSFFLTASLMLIARGERAMQTVAFGILAAGFVLLMRYSEALAAAVHAIPFLGSFFFVCVAVLIAMHLSSYNENQVIP